MRLGEFMLELLGILDTIQFKMGLLKRGPWIREFTRFEFFCLWSDLFLVFMHVNAASDDNHG